MNIRIRKISYLALLAIFVLGLGACNTMRGVGQDTEHAGKEIQEESREHQHHD